MSWKSSTPLATREAWLAKNYMSKVQPEAEPAEQVEPTISTRAANSRLFEETWALGVVRKEIGTAA